MKSEDHLQVSGPVQRYALACTRNEPSMILLALVCLFAGILLGLYFQFYVLIPATPLGLLAVVGTGFASGVGPWWIALDASVAVLAIQIGYIAGSILYVQTSPISRRRPVKKCHTAEYAPVGPRTPVARRRTHHRWICPVRAGQVVRLGHQSPSGTLSRRAYWVSSSRGGARHIRLEPWSWLSLQRVQE